MELLFKGGFMMIPILVLFVITIYILIEKILIINRESKSPKGFTDEIISRVKNDDINGAKLVCTDTNNPGDKVITTPITFVATANCISYCGAEVIFSDIDKSCFLNFFVPSLMVLLTSNLFNPLALLKVEFIF